MVLVIGILRIVFEGDLKIQKLALRVVPNISDNLLLGMDFVRTFDFEN